MQNLMKHISTDITNAVSELYLCTFRNRMHEQSYVYVRKATFLRKLGKPYEFLLSFLYRMPFILKIASPVYFNVEEYRNSEKYNFLYINISTYNDLS